MQRFRIDLGYVGTHFHGWAVQPNVRTVQGELEAALTQILGFSTRVTVAGRTDAGVHARRQVVHVDVPHVALDRLVGQAKVRGRGPSPRTPAQGLQSRLAGVLAHRHVDDVTIHAVSAVTQDFDARFSALWRSYTYRLADPDAFVDPLTALYTVKHRVRLNHTAMAQASELMCGLHDFLPFCKPREDSTTIRTLHQLDVTRTPEGVIVLYLKADAFCHHMVRAIVGALAHVGEGKWPVGRPRDLLDAARAGGTEFPMYVFPAHGLVLEDVGYPRPGEWAARNQQTRARRDTV